MDDKIPIVELPLDSLENMQVMVKVMACAEKYGMKSSEVLLELISQAASQITESEPSDSNPPSQS